MRRRDFIALLGGAAAWPVTARTQPRAKLPLIGFLSASTPALASDRTAAFRKRLRELGWTEGSSIAVEYRWAEGNLDRAREAIREFARAKVDAIVTHGTQNVAVAKDMAADIPVVFAVAADPVGTGL